MSLFNFKTTKKQIEIFEQNVAEILEINFPEIKKTLASTSQAYSIHFSKKPCGIYLLRDVRAQNKIHSFDLYGLKIFNKKLQEYEAITLFFSNNILTLIEVNNPEKFHKIYDYSKLEIGKLTIKEIYNEDQDTQQTLNILKNVSQDRLNQLEIGNAIEIQITKISYYTILNLDAGNFIAVDKTGKVYHLDPQDTQKAKEISKNIDLFFDLYKGDKSSLMEIIKQQKTQP